MDRLFGFRQRAAEPGDTPADRLRRRFAAFQALLAENNAVLELMADMEEKRSGEFLFDRAYLEQSVGAVVPAVGRIVASLDALTGGRYPDLAAAHARIAAEVARALSRTVAVPPDAPLVLALPAVTGADTLLAGGKMAHLGELRNRLGLAVPEGFAITAAAFLRFLRHNDLAGRIAALLAAARPESLAAVDAASDALRRLIVEAEVPAEVLAAIGEALAALEGPGPPGRYAVRSSAVGEDGDLSFAGQYATFLNVAAADVVRRYQEVLASLFSPRAVFYCMTKGFAAEELVMAVGVLRMVDSASAGVLYTRDPAAPGSGEGLVSAVRGLGLAVVDGSAPHDLFRLDRESGAVRERRIGAKSLAIVPAAGEGTRAEPLPAGAGSLPALDDGQLRELRLAGAALEAHYGEPQDVEWAFDRGGRLVLLQARPLHVAAPDERAPLPRRFAGHAVLLDAGEIASRGAGCGPVFLLRDEADLAAVPAGAVLVARTTSTRLVAVMPRIAAIVTDVGGTAGHMASLAREFGVPALLDTGTATRALPPGAEVTVDAIHGTVYAGRVEPLLAYVAARREPLAGTPLVRTLAALLRPIAPLHLTDPADPGFRADACRTLHDVTRFAHEKAMEELFEAGSDKGLAEGRTIVLLAGIPVGVHLIDLGGGVRAGARKAGAEDILSVPFAALLAGMRAMRWPDPPPVDAGGFMGMVARTTQIPEEELRESAERSFAVVGASYLHFSIRLGYHFSLVEAFVGERLNDNYIRFFFKGGGAVRERRLRRVRLIAEILRLMDFQVKVTDDVIEAAVLKFRRPDLERRLTALGRLTAYTKQLDMAMFNDDVTDWYRDEFVKEHWAEA